MNWKRHKNELIVLIAFVLMLASYIYKSQQISAQQKYTQDISYSLQELKEVIALKKIWADKKINKKLNTLEVLIPKSKVSWTKKNKKITAVYTGLSANELNKLTTKILNLPIVITLLDIQKIGSSYTMEFKCKW